VYSDGMVAVHCDKDANNNATGGLMLSGASTHTYAKSLYINGGTVSLDSDLTLTGNAALWAVWDLYVNGGTFKVTSSSSAFFKGGNFEMSGGTLQPGPGGAGSHGTLRMSGAFVLSGGTVSMSISGDGFTWDRILVTLTGKITGGTLSLTMNGAYQAWRQPSNRVLIAVQSWDPATDWAALTFTCNAVNILLNHTGTTLFVYPSP
jgi:hypothetical protein